MAGYKMGFVLLKRRVLLLAFALSFFPCFSQNGRLDSLMSVADNMRGPQKVDALIDVVREYAKTDYTQSLVYISSAEALALQLGDSSRIVRSMRIKGQLLNRLERPLESIRVLTAALPIAERNNYQEDFKTILNNLAIGYAILAEYDKALEIHFKTLALREADDDKAQISISLNNIGFVYFKLKNYEKAIDYFNRSLSLKKQISDSYDVDRLLINIGLSNIHLRNFPEAKARITEGLAVCGDHCEGQILIEGEFGLGVCQFNLGDVGLSGSHFRKSLRLAEEVGNTRFGAENLIYLGRLAMREERYDSAKSHLQQAEILALKSGYNQLLIDAYREQSKLFALLEDYENATLYDNRYTALKDSLIGEELVNNITALQAQFEERENLSMIKVRQDALSFQRYLNMGIGLVAFLAGVLLFVLYRSRPAPGSGQGKAADGPGGEEPRDQ